MLMSPRANTTIGAAAAAAVEALISVTSLVATAPLFVHGGGQTDVSICQSGPDQPLSASHDLSYTQRNTTNPRDVTYKAIT